MTLSGIWTVSKCESVFRRCVEHMQMYLRTFMTGETDVSQFAGFFCIERCFNCPARRENSLRIVHSNHFVEIGEGRCDQSGAGAVIRQFALQPIPCYGRLSWS